MEVMSFAADVLANHAHGGPGGWWFIFPLFWILLWGTVIFFVFRARRGWGRWHSGQSGENVLAERYARGEITEQEYRERQSVLKETRS
jgi:putative membrane protein